MIHVDKASVYPVFADDPIKSPLHYQRTAQSVRDTTWTVVQGSGLKIGKGFESAKLIC
jgi:hypothetical protein